MWGHSADIGDAGVVAGWLGYYWGFRHVLNDIARNSPLLD